MSTAIHSEAKATEMPERQLDLLRLLGYLQLQHGQHHRAVLIFDALLALCPSDPSLFLLQACALIRCGKSASAISLLDSFPAHSGDQTLAWLLRGQALAAVGQVAESARAMRMFIRLRHAEARKG